MVLNFWNIYHFLRKRAEDTVRSGVEKNTSGFKTPQPLFVSSRNAA